MDEITGKGATVAFTSLAEVGNLLSVGNLAQTLEKLDISHLGTTDYKEYRPGDLGEPGELSLKCQFDTKQDLPTLGDDDELTITLPLQEAGNTEATLVVSGWFSQVSTPETGVNKVCEVEFKFQTDQVTFTWTPEVTPP